MGMTIDVRLKEFVIQAWIPKEMMVVQNSGPRGNDRATDISAFSREKLKGINISNSSSHSELYHNRHTTLNGLG